MYVKIFCTVTDKHCETDKSRRASLIEHTLYHKELVKVSLKAKNKEIMVHIKQKFMMSVQRNEYIDSERERVNKQNNKSH